MDQIFDYLFKQGLGYVLFLGACFIAYTKDRQLMAEKDKNATVIERITQINVSTTKDLLNGYANLQKSVDGINNALANVVNILNSK